MSDSYARERLSNSHVLSAPPGLASAASACAYRSLTEWPCSRVNPAPSGINTDEIHNASGMAESAFAKPHQSDTVGFHRWCCYAVT